MLITSIVNYLLLATVVLLPELQLLYLPIGGSGLIQLVISVVAIIVSLSDNNFKKVFRSQPMIIWLVWAIYTTVNWLVVGTKSNIPDWSFIFNRIWLAYITMIIAYYELRKDLKKTSVFLCFVLMAFIIIGLFSQGSIRFDDVRGGLTLGNELPLVACTAFFVASFCYRNNYLRAWVPVLTLLLVIIASLFVAERKSFVAALIVLFFLVAPLDTLKKPSRWIPLLVIIIIAYIGITWMLENTLLGDRFLITKDEGERFTDNPYLTFLGDRAVFYEGGWLVFLDNPLTGVGLRNFSLFGYSELVLHTEYMVQLCEGGIIGTALFLMFVYSIIKYLRSAKKNRYCNISVLSVCIGELLSIAFLCIITWTYDAPHYFIAISIILAFCKQNHEFSKITKRFR